jgi:di/tricarboxylate transporter
MYVSDAFGYLGSTCVLLFKNFANAKVSWVEFFKISALSTAVLLIFVSFLAFVYFRNSDKKTVEVVYLPSDIKEQEVVLG